MESHPLLAVGLVGFGILPVAVVGWLLARRMKGWPKWGTPVSLGIIILIGLCSAAFLAFSPFVTVISNLSSGQVDDGK